MPATLHLLQPSLDLDNGDDGDGDNGDDGDGDGDGDDGDGDNGDAVPQSPSSSWDTQV